MWQGHKILTSSSADLKTRKALRFSGLSGNTCQRYPDPYKKLIKRSQSHIYA